EMLAGRRLFKGESDLETFKQVQAAVVPDMRQLRQDVSDDLAYVLGKALARDRDQRYLQAGDFAKDLSIVIDRLGKPVTYQDLAKLVMASAGERAKKRKVEHKDAAGVVGDLILDALHDFSGGGAELGSTSLGTRGISAPAASSDFVDPSEWGLDALFDEAPAPPAVQPAPAPVPRAAAAPPVPPVPPSAATAAPVPPSAAIAAPAPQPPLPAAQRARPPAAAMAPGAGSSGAAPAEGGPWWRRWFGN
ncbi:MAG TPA: hypothetical protein VIW29_18675, partial [Polyangiaceae bacterium]